MLEAPITIEDQDYHEILTPVGYPFVAESDLEFDATEIKQHFILPAMREYFKWFPFTEITAQTVSNRFEIAYPDLTTFGVVDARLNASPPGGTSVSNPLINELLYTRRSTGRYGIRHNYDMTQARIIEKMENQSFINYGRAFRVMINKQNRTVTGYTTITGELAITWAKYDSEFSSIPFNHVRDVIKLSQAYLLQGIGELRGQSANNTEVEFNAQNFLDKASKLEEEVMERFKAHTKVVLMRG